MDDDQIEAVARRVVALLRAEREGAARAALGVSEIERAETAADMLEHSLIRLRAILEAR